MSAQLSGRDMHKSVRAVADNQRIEALCCKPILAIPGFCVECWPKHRSSPGLFPDKNCGARCVQSSNEGVVLLLLLSPPGPLQFGAYFAETQDLPYPPPSEFPGSTCFVQLAALWSASYGGDRLDQLGWWCVSPYRYLPAYRGIALYISQVAHLRRYAWPSRRFLSSCRSTLSMEEVKKDFFIIDINIYVFSAWRQLLFSKKWQRANGTDARAGLRVHLYFVC